MPYSQTGYDGPKISDIIDELENRVADLAANLLPGGHRDGQLWRCGDLYGNAPRKGGDGSLVVYLTGPRRGWWRDFNGMDKSRDILELITQGQCNGDKKAAIKWSIDYLGWGHMSDEAKQNLEVTRKKNAERRLQEAAQVKTDNTKKMKRAKAIYLSGQPLLDSPVETYLAGRGLRIRDLGRVPGAIKYHPEVWNREKNKKLPAMVAVVVGEAGFMTVHRTWLQIHGNGQVSKADLIKPKMVYSPSSGGHVPLWRGEVTDPDSGEITPAPPLKKAPPGSTVVISEGIEDGLNYALCNPSHRVIAAISLSNFANLWLPSNISDLILGGQNDEGDAAKALISEGHKLQARNFCVDISKPPAGFKDINDYYQSLLREFDAKKP